ncbi:MAG: ATP synthase F0 subunit C [bacterium]|jgi:F-type H+-transporting ATPase subunit c|nr:ATP synthase F0 subunit C [Chloroflexota bacterium]
MDNLPGGIAALGVIGPAIGVGLAAAAAATAIGRNPEAAGPVRGVFILGAAFAEGLGVLAIVLGILTLVLK